MSGRRLALVTGASEGIGRELARVLAANGHDLFLAARNADRLNELAAEITATGRPSPLIFAGDLSLPEGCAQAYAAARAAGTVEILVNNAGFGITGAFADSPHHDQLNMIDLNVRALTDLTYLCLPDLRAAKGYILNLASVASFAPGPGMAVYYASKAYVLSFSEALHEELKPEGVRVTALCPGPVLTRFQARAGIKSIALPSNLLLSPYDMALAGYHAMMAGKRVATPGFANKLLAGVLSHAPHAASLPLLASNQMARRGKKPKIQP